jgi:phosphate transport system substrate-binding protein
MTVRLTASEQIVPIVLAVVLVCSLAGFLVGTRRYRAGRDHWLRLVAIGVTLALVGATIGQIIAYRQYIGAPAVPDEVNLEAYRPFTSDNLLVVPPSAPSLGISADWPRLDGATALYPVYAAVAQAVYNPGRPTGLDFTSFYVPCSGTGDAYSRLIAGQADVIFVAQPSAAQLADLNATGRKLTLTPLGREAFVFFVNAGNPVNGLSLQQIRDIYTRTTTNWRQVGGRNEAITAFQRPDGSGSQTAMLAQVMGDVPIAQPRRDEVSEMMGGVLSQVATHRNVGSAIGYSFRWYVTVMNPNAGIKLLAVDGIAPTAANIADGTYPLTGDFYAVTLGDPSRNTQALIDWLTSAEGQSLIEQVGYVGLQA